MFIHAVCHRLAAVTKWPPPPCRVTALAVPISGYGRAAFLLRGSGIRFAPTEIPSSRNRIPARSKFAAVKRRSR